MPTMPRTLDATIRCVEDGCECMAAGLTPPVVTNADGSTSPVEVEAAVAPSPRRAAAAPVPEADEPE